MIASSKAFKSETCDGDIPIPDLHTRKNTLHLPQLINNTTKTTKIPTINPSRKSSTIRMCFGFGPLSRRQIYREEVLIAPRPVRYSTSHGHRHTHNHHHGHTHRHSAIVTGQRVHETRTVTSRPASRVYVQAPLVTSHGSRHSTGARRAVPVAVVTETRRRSQVLR